MLSEGAGQLQGTGKNDGTSKAETQTLRSGSLSRCIEYGIFIRCSRITHAEWLDKVRQYSRSLSLITYMIAS